MTNNEGKTPEAEATVHGVRMCSTEEYGPLPDGLDTGEIFQTILKPGQAALVFQDLEGQHFLAGLFVGTDEHRMIDLASPSARLVIAMHSFMEAHPEFLTEMLNHFDQVYAQMQAGPLPEKEN